MLNHSQFFYALLLDYRLFFALLTKSVVQVAHKINFRQEQSIDIPGLLGFILST